jgi:UDP-sugar transporter A1/2/3
MILLGPGGGSISRLIHVISFEVLAPAEMVKLSVPACLYLIQNNLLYYALSHLRATPYKVTYNLKIITGAFFSVTMLGQKLGFRKWVALAALMIGVSIVQLNKHENVHEDGSSEQGEGGDHLIKDDPNGQFLGFLAVFAAAVTSGFCGVYQQRILQRSGGNIWVRNAQMGLSSCLFGIGAVLIKDIDAVLENGFFQGYSKLVWAVIFLQSFGGLNVAFILRYADNILKGFAAAFSTMASCLFEVIYFGFQPTGPFLLGALLINVAVFLYNTPSAPPSKKTVTTKALSPKSKVDLV